jgi:SSS family solute:Na+ symporter
MGLFRLAVDTPVKLSNNFAYEQGSFLWIVNNIFFQYYSLLITVVCIIVFIIVSYMSKAPDYAKISGLTFSTLTEKDKTETRSSWSTMDVVFSVLLVLVIIAIYVYFSG